MPAAGSPTSPLGSSLERLVGEYASRVGCLSALRGVKGAEGFLTHVERSLHTAVALLAVPAYTTDAGGTITFYNAAAALLAGRRARIGADRWCVTWRLYQPDGTPLPHDRSPMAAALKANRPVRGVDAVAERPDGTRVPFTPHPTPLQDASGTLMGGVNVLIPHQSLAAWDGPGSWEDAGLGWLMGSRVPTQVAAAPAAAAPTCRRAHRPDAACPIADDHGRSRLLRDL